MSLYPGFPLAQSDYTVGTIDLNSGSKNFTLSGANPLDFAAATAGDEIYIPQAGKLLLIETITNSSGTLVYPCPVDCAGENQPFHLRLKPSASRVQGMVTTLLQKLGSGNLAGLDELTLPENHVIAGGQVAGEVKAVNLPEQMNTKLDKTGGTVTGDLTVNGTLISLPFVVQWNGIGIGDAHIYVDGNIYGPYWQDWHQSGWIKQAIDARMDFKIAAALANL